MAQTEKKWHPNFIKYMQEIVRHPNYKGLAIEYDIDGMPRWLATAKSEVGKSRMEWAEGKANELGINLGSGVYAKVMFLVHPTKMKVCQICGQQMSIRYIYPSAIFSKIINSLFGVDIGTYDSVYDLWDKIIKNGYKSSDIIALINAKFGTSFAPSELKEIVLSRCEEMCRLGGKSYFGPGAMSNFPDRFDGFHSYNRCCRSAEDKGRSKDNMKTYNRDRRAYEYWSDGNIMAANKFMHSNFFNGMSADHVGPISLGFVHDSHYLRPMTGSDNSTKRDRLSKDIIDEVISIENQTGVCPMSWYSMQIWRYIVANYTKNESRISGEYRNMLKQNMSNYMYMLGEILSSGDSGRSFLYHSLIHPKVVDFKYDYTFDDLGNITSRNIRNITERASGEFMRFERIAINAVVDYNDKDNRNMPNNLNTRELLHLRNIINLIKNNKNTVALIQFRDLVNSIQTRLISDEQ